MHALYLLPLVVALWCLAVNGLSLWIREALYQLVSTFDEVDAYVCRIVTVTCSLS